MKNMYEQVRLKTMWRRWIETLESLIYPRDRSSYMCIMADGINGRCVYLQFETQTEPKYKYCQYCKCWSHWDFHGDSRLFLTTGMDW